MKQVIIPGITLLLLTATQSCVLTEEPVIDCDKNAPLVVNGEDQCGHVFVDLHSESMQFDENIHERFIFHLSYSGVTRGLGISVQDKKVEENETYFSDSYFSGEGITGDVSITVTKLDRQNRTISVEYDFAGKWFNENNSTNYDQTATGEFINVNY